MILITNTYDLICLICGVIGTLLCVYQLYLYDWDIKSLFLGDEVDTHLERKEGK